MTPQEFKASITELESYYEKPYNQKMLSVLWRMLGCLNRQEMGQVINAITEDSFRQPNPAQIRKAALPWLRRAWERQRAQAIDALLSTGVRCKLCDNSGLLPAYLKASPMHEYSFRCCYCKAAEVRNLSQSIPPWERELAERYQPIPYEGRHVEAYQKVQAEAVRSGQARRDARTNVELSKLAMKVVKQIQTGGADFGPEETEDGSF